MRLPPTRAHTAWLQTDGEARGGSAAGLLLGTSCGAQSEAGEAEALKARLGQEMLRRVRSRGWGGTLLRLQLPRPLPMEGL